MPVTERRASAPVRAAILGMAGVLLLATAAWGDGKSTIRIYRYDDKGNVIGVVEKEHTPAPGQPAPDDPATSPPGVPPAGPRDYRTPQRPAIERFEPDEILVANAPPTLLPVAQSLGFVLVERIALPNLGLSVLRLRVPPGESVAAALATIRDRFPGVVTDPNEIFDLSGNRVDSTVARSLVGWEGDVTAACGRGIRIGMIDTAVDLQHPALRGQRLKAESFLDPGQKPAAADHGTAVAALLVGRAQGTPFAGLLPGAALYAGNVFAQSEGGETRGNLAAMMRALDWLARERVQVVNLSLAGSHNQMLKLVIDRALQKGLILVAAAGNGGAEAAPAFPAAYEDVLAVTAVDRSLSIYAYANRGSYIDFAAPGVNLWTATPAGGTVQSGTSFAAPFVTSLVAHHRHNGVLPDAASLRQALRNGARDLGAPGKDPLFGWGLVHGGTVCPAP